MGFFFLGSVKKLRKLIFLSRWKQLNVGNKKWIETYCNFSHHSGQDSRLCYHNSMTQKYSSRYCIWTRPVHKSFLLIESYDLELNVRVNINQTGIDVQGTVEKSSIFCYLHHHTKMPLSVLMYKKYKVIYIPQSCSSERSSPLQSWIPSHCCERGMHCFDVLHWK